MSTEVNLPALGESVTEGTVTRWLKQVGDEVAVDEPLLEVSTDKVDTEIPSPAAGTLLEIKAQEDDTVEVGAVLAVIGEADEAGGQGGGGDGDGGEAAGAGSHDQDGDQPADDGGADSDVQRAEAEPEPEQDSQEQQPAGAEQPATAEPQEEEKAGGAADGGTEQQPGEDSSGIDDGDDSGRSGDGGGGGERSPVTLPALGESVTEGTVTRWLKSVGDEVAVDEPLLEVSTDKVDTEIPSPVAGTLLEIKVEEDETVEVGAELAVIGSGQPADAGEQPAAGAEGTGKTEPAEQAEESAQAEQPEPEQAQPQPVSEHQEPEAEQEPEPAEPAREEAPPPSAQSPSTSDTEQQDRHQDADGADPADSGGDGHGYVTPLVRKLAAQHGVDLTWVTGTGVGGRIRKQDVLEAAKAAKAREAEAAPQPAPASAQEESKPQGPSVTPSPLRGKTEPLSRLRKVIAKRMVESLQTSAQLTTVVEVDVTAISRLRDAVKQEFAAREGVKLSFMPFFAKATVDALKQHPALNAAIDSELGEVTYFDKENLAIAVDTEKGLLTPVIKEAGDLSVAGLARKIADLAERTRASKISPDELSGGTFTLTNTGSRGALFDTPIINQPQVGILGTGAVVKRPVVIDDPNLGETIAVRQMCYLALTYDHRLVDGADAARFLSEVKQRLESGQFEV